MDDRVRLAIALTALALASACQASPLRLEQTITLPGVVGRIDHLAIDLRAGRLFLAEYGNGSVDVVDPAVGKVIGRIGGLHEPQGVAVLDDG